MKLAALLSEITTAAQKAAKLGLVHKGFGYYGPKKGEATHKSAEGGHKLEKLKKAYGKKLPKPSKKAKKYAKKTEPIARAKTIGKSKVITYKGSEWADLDLTKAQKKKWVDPIIQGEEIHLLGNNSQANTLLQHLKGNSRESSDVSRKAAKMNEKFATQQHKSWTKKLANNHPKAFAELMNIQSRWQNYAQWKESSSAYRKSRNRRLNNILMGKFGGKRAVTKVPAKGIERGMQLNPSDAKTFLKQFRIGKRVVLPPSGWSAKKDLARSFGPGSPWSTSQDVSVIMTLKPKKGSNNTMIAYQCRGAGEIGYEIESRGDEAGDKLQYQIDTLEDKLLDLEWDEKEDTALYRKLEKKHRDLQNQLFDLESQGTGDYFEVPDGYEEEHEIIRPGGVAQIVTKVRKYVFWNTDWSTGKTIPKLVYHIELEDRGAVGKSLWKEAKEPVESQSVKDIILKYMNTTFRRTKVLTPKKLLKKYMNSNLRGGNAQTKRPDSGK